MVNNNKTIQNMKLNNILIAKIMEYMQLHATYAMIYTLDKLWITLLKGGMPTEIYGKTIKRN